VAVAAQLAHAQPVEPPARGALDDLGPLQFRDGPEHLIVNLFSGLLTQSLPLMMICLPYFRSSPRMIV
jgi:hypothetical protein